MSNRAVFCRICTLLALAGASFSFATSPVASARTGVAQAGCGSWKVVPAANPASHNGQLTSVTVISPSDAWAVGSNGFGVAAIEHWNGRRWAIVASPSPPESTLYSVSGLSRTNVWAVGESHENSAKVWSLIEHWNGTLWKTVPAPVIPNAGLNGVFARSARDVWAVGSKYKQSGSRGLIEHWNGGTWSVVKSPQGRKYNDRNLDSITATSARNAWAVGADDGDPVIEHWNGVRWSAVPAGELPQQIALDAVAAKSPTDVWAVGQGGEYGRAVAEHWNGKLWKVFDTAFIPVGKSGYLNTELVSITPGAGKKMWAVGYRSNEEGPDQALVERWNGRRWKVVLTGMHRATRGLYTALNGVAASRSRRSGIWTVGTVGDGSDTVGSTLTARWKGMAWKTVASPNPAAASSELLAVDAPADSPAWAVGDTLVDGYAQGLAEQWTGRRWVNVPTPPISGRSVYLNSVEAVGPNDVWAVGWSEPPRYDGKNGVADSQRLIEHWNGSRWSIVPGVKAMPVGELFGVSADSPQDVWVVGWEAKWGWNNTTPLVERWNGTVWKRMPNPPGMDQIALQDQNPLTYEIVALSSADVWVASTFGTLDHWNGTKWASFTSPSGKEGSAYLFGLSASSPSDVWSAGYSYFDNDNPWLSLASRWTGASWREVHTIDPTSFTNVFHAVVDISPSDVWVIGDDENGLLAEHFDGTRFRTVPMAPSQAGFVGADGNTSTVWTVGSGSVDYANVPASEQYTQCSP